MFKDFLKRLGHAVREEGVQQSGLIPYDPTGSDYLAGTLPYEVRNIAGMWEDYLPEGEQQNNPFVFDTLSCATFTLMNLCETTLAGINLPKAHKEFLQKNGYYKNGKLNFSDRFIAILSGTTKNGNTYKNVAEAIRTFGLIPDTMFPFSGEKTFEEYHNRNLITPEMLKLGKEFLSFFSGGYEFILVKEDNDITKDEKASIEYHLKQSPLAIGIPRPSSHAVLMPSFYNIFDSYSPFYKKGKKNIHYVFKFVIAPKVVVPEKPADWPYKNFTPAEVKGLDFKLVDKLQAMRDIVGVPIKINSGLRNANQNEGAGGVPDSAHMKGLAVDIQCIGSRNNYNFTKAAFAVGFRRIGDGGAKNFLHLDIDSSKDQDVKWHY